ncbi:MAG: hypothetical protein CXR31_00945 [Geobacter sp.]|nr:MAG: hypothetical protein CXR31_00945 [Geobacter sp.]
MYGPDRLIKELLDLGYEVEKVAVANDKFFGVIKRYEVPVGRFQGKTIDLGIQATIDFPRTVASAIHVLASPQLYEKTDSIQGVRNITDSVLGPEWRYWSRNFGWQGEKSARRLMNQIKGIFANA